MSQGHVMQPIETDKDGVVRFKQNKIVRDLLDFCSARGFSLNEIAIKDYAVEDRQQLAQLIGYSLCGYGELGYVTPDALGTAEKMASEGLSLDAARANYLQDELDALRESLREPVARLFGVHPNDLKGV